MSDTTTLIIAAALLIAVGLVVYIMRGQIKNGEVRVGGVTAKVGTHEPDRLVVKGVEQTSEKGSNTTAIRSANVTVDGLKQTAQKDNVLDIGNP